MKQLKLSWLYLFSALMISSGVLVGCQKDVQDPSVTSGASRVKTPTASVTGPNWGNFQVEITSPGIGCPDKEFFVSGKLINNSGSPIGEEGNKVFIITPLGLTEKDATDDGEPMVIKEFGDLLSVEQGFTYSVAGTYYFKVEFDVNINSDNNPTVSTITSVVVDASNCDDDTENIPCSVSLTATRVTLGVNDLGFTGTYAVEFKVTKKGDCPLPTDYKLQGGLTSGTVVSLANDGTVTSSGTGQYRTTGGVQGFLRKATGSQTNSSINWINNPVLQNGDNYFWVEFTKPTKTYDQFLTGSWSIKGVGFPDSYADRVSAY